MWSSLSSSLRFGGNFQVYAPYGTTEKPAKVTELETQAHNYLTVGPYDDHAPPAPPAESFGAGIPVKAWSVLTDYTALFAAEVSALPVSMDNTDQKNQHVIDTFMRTQNASNLNGGIGFTVQQIQKVSSVQLYDQT